MNERKPAFLKRFAQQLSDGLRYCSRAIKGRRTDTGGEQSQDDGGSKPDDRATHYQAHARYAISTGANRDRLSVTITVPAVDLLKWKEHILPTATRYISRIVRNVPICISGLHVTNEMLKQFEWSFAAYVAEEVHAYVAAHPTVEARLKPQFPTYDMVADSKNGAATWVLKCLGADRIIPDPNFDGFTVRVVWERADETTQEES